MPRTEYIRVETKEWLGQKDSHTLYICSVPIHNYMYSYIVIDLTKAYEQSFVHGCMVGIEAV